MGIIISQAILNKLKTKHKVDRNEVMECFENREGKLLLDNRAAHKDPPTYWFIAETNHQRELKVCFVIENGNYFLRSTFEPNAEERRIYKKYGAE